MLNDDKLSLDDLEEGKTSPKGAKMLKGPNANATVNAMQKKSTLSKNKDGSRGNQHLGIYEWQNPQSQRLCNMWKSKMQFLLEKSCWRISCV